MQTLQRKLTFGEQFFARFNMRPGVLGLFRSENTSTDLMLKISYLVLQVLDLGLTILAMSLGSVELNPIVRASLDSPVQLAVLKGGLPLLIAWMLPGKFLIPGIVFLAFVVGWDVKELMQFYF